MDFRKVQKEFPIQSNHFLIHGAYPLNSGNFSDVVKDLSKMGLVLNLGESGVRISDRFQKESSMTAIGLAGILVDGAMIEEDSSRLYLITLKRKDNIPYRKAPVAFTKTIEKYCVDP